MFIHKKFFGKKVIFEVSFSNHRSTFYMKMLVAKFYLNSVFIINGLLLLQFFDHNYNLSSLLIIKVYLLFLCEPLKMCTGKSS